MILIFGGTTEGRSAVRVAAQGGGSGGGHSAQDDGRAVGTAPVPAYIYSTLGDAHQVATPRGERLTGGLDAFSAIDLCRRRGVRLIIDAAHPFATGVHLVAGSASAACGVPVIRYERRSEAAEGAIWCDDFSDAVRRLEKDGVERLLALTGVRTIPKLRDFWTRHPTRFRVLNRPSSVAEAIGYGFPRDNLIFFHEDESETEVLRREAPDAVITKESGAEGGFPAKVVAARALGVPLYAVRRPPMPTGFHTVYTEAGLRRRIEELLPDYFTLRSGLSTGACATAAAVAALRGLLEGEILKEASVILPAGESVVLPVENMSSGEVAVIKDAGDDPDVTNGCRIIVRVKLTETGGIRFLQGEGVGRVTLPGLGIEVGEPAINPAPRRMIRENFAALGITNAYVTISVENGAELAKKTLNQRLGIVGGISIIGTSGFVQPFSAEAFVETIEREIDVAWAVGCRKLIINSGARSEAAVRGKFPNLLPQAFVHYGNFVGETLRLAARRGFRQVAMGAMMGKAVKLAEGHLDTHNKRARMNREFLAELAAEAGCSPEALRTIAEATLARELWSLAPDDLARFVKALVEACHRHLDPLVPELEIFLIDEEGALVGVE